MPTDNRAPDHDAGLDGGTDGEAPLRELVVYHPRDGVQIVPLYRDRPVVLGRSEPSDIVFTRSDELSRRHAAFTGDTSGVWIEDLESLNGTLVNGEPIQGRRRFSPGDRASIRSISVWLNDTRDPVRRPQRLHGHEKFQELVQAELERAREFRRPLAILHLRGDVAPDVLVAPWVSRVRDHLRLVDAAALFAPDTVEILLPEAPAALAQATARRLVSALAPRGGLTCGIAMGPDSKSRADELSDAAHRAALRATPGAPVLEHEEPEAVATSAAAAGSPVVRDPAMVSLYEVVDTISRTTISVLILGATGTGKEVVAREIHARSLRRNAPFLVINCGAISPQLVESTLFGHEKGAFTGADKLRRGAFEDANGGTLLLDEIAELSLPAQVALLRVLDHHTIQRVGSTREIPVDVRVLAATNKDLDAMSREGLFRIDLLYRLTPMRLHVPPIKDRPSELRPLVARFIDDFNRKHKRSIRGVSAEAMEMIESYDWPGNVRELRNEIERAVVMAPGDTITAEVLPAKIAHPTPRTPDRQESVTPDTFDLKARMRREETALIRAALGEAGDKRVLASQLLGIPRRTLLHKMREYGIQGGDTAMRLPEAVDEDGQPLTFADRMARFEARLIHDVLARTDQDVAESARLLRIQPRTLKKRIVPPHDD